MSFPRQITAERSRLLAELQKKMLVSFSTLSYLNDALTHSSYVYEYPHCRDNERLEFFGDAVLKFVVSEYLFKEFPDCDEGKLTEIRAVLVNAKTLHSVSEIFDLSPYLLTASGMAIKPSMLAGSMEAILGAIYLDLGMEAASVFINRHFCSQANTVAADRIKDNYKAQLQQLTQGRAQGIPAYSVIKTEGPPHDAIFTVTVSVGNQCLAQGSGRSKKSAEQEAARLAYLQLDSADDAV